MEGFEEGNKNEQPGYVRADYNTQKIVKSLKRRSHNENNAKSQIHSGSLGESRQTNYDYSQYSENYNYMRKGSLVSTTGGNHPDYKGFMIGHIYYSIVSLLCCSGGCCGVSITSLCCIIALIVGNRHYKKGEYHTANGYFTFVRIITWLDVIYLLFVFIIYSFIICAYIIAWMSQ